MDDETAPRPEAKAEDGCSSWESIPREYLEAFEVAADRVRDRESLPRLRSFRQYWMRKRRGS